MSGRQYTGRTSGALGKKTYFRPTKAGSNLRPQDILSIHSEGRESKNSAEHACDEFVLGLLKGEKSLENEWIEKVWMSVKKAKAESKAKRRKFKGGEGEEERKAELVVDDGERLNPSQANVVRAMTESPEEKIVLVHG